MSRPWDWSAVGLDADPVPGSAADVRATAQEARGTADLIARQATALRSVSARSDDAWRGEAAREFRLAAAPLADAIAKAEGRYRDLAGALETHADGLELLQSQADAALERAEDARQALRRADVVAAGAEPGSAEEQDHRDAQDRADRDLEAERALLRRIAGDGPVGSAGEFGALNDALVAAVELAGDDELKDTWWDEVKQGIHESRGWMNTLHDALTALTPLLLLVAMVFPVFAFAAGLVVAALMLAITLALTAAGDATMEDVGADVVGLGAACFGLGALRAVGTATRVTRQSVISSSASRAAKASRAGAPARKAAARERQAHLDASQRLGREADAISADVTVRIVDGLVTGGALELHLMSKVGSQMGPAARRHYRDGIITGLSNGLLGAASGVADGKAALEEYGEVQRGTYWSSKLAIHVGSL